MKPTSNTSLLNANRTETVQHIGNENRPVLIIDEAFADPDELRRTALSQHYTAIGEFYPGLRAPLPSSYSATLIDTLGPRLTELFGADADGLIGESFYSLVTTSPERLLPIQRLPHYDGVGEDQFAAIAYLSRQDFGGTAFFRHNATGFETVNASRFAPYKAALEADVRQHGLPAQRYLTDGAPLFDRIARVPAQFNRLVVYRGIQLHSGAIADPATLSNDPAKGRLTITSFFKRGEGGA